MNNMIPKHNSDNLTISMREYFLRLLEQWKCILLFTIIVTVIFCAAMHSRSSDAANAEKRNEETLIASSTEDLLMSLDEYDRDLVASAYKLYIESSQLNDYIHNAPIMNVDAYNVKQLKMVWAVKADADEKKPIVDAYYNYFHTGVFLAPLTKCYEEQYKKIESDDYVITDDPLYSQQMQYKNTVNLTIIIPNDIDEKNVEEIVLKQLNAYKKGLIEQGNPHELSLLLEETVIGKNEQLLARQEEKYRQFADYNNRLANTTNLFTTAQSAAYDSLIKRDKLLTKGNIDDVQPAPTFSKKMVGSGIIIGIFLYAIVYFLYLLLSGIIHDPVILENNVGLKSLGEWASGRSEKRGLVYNLMSDPFVYGIHHKGHLDREKAIQFSTETIVNAAKHIDAETILCLSPTTFNSQKEAFYSEITARATERGISVSTLSVSDKDSEGPIEKAVAEADGVVLLVDGRKTKMKECQPIFGQCSYYETPAMGFIYTT